MGFGPWLSTQRRRETTRGTDFYNLACSPSEMTLHVGGNLTDACRALERAATLMPCTDDSEDDQRSTWIQARSTFVRDIVDALDSIGSVLNAVGCGDKELELLYDAINDGIARNDRVCTECKSNIDGAGAGFDLPDDVSVCGKKCETSYNQKVLPSVAVRDVQSGAEPVEK